VNALASLSKIEECFAQLDDPSGASQGRWRYILFEGRQPQDRLPGVPDAVPANEPFVLFRTPGGFYVPGIVASRTIAEYYSECLRGDLTPTDAAEAIIEHTGKKRLFASAILRLEEAARSADHQRRFAQLARALATLQRDKKIRLRSFDYEAENRIGIHLEREASIIHLEKYEPKPTDAELNVRKLLSDKPFDSFDAARQREVLIASRREYVHAHLRREDADEVERALDPLYEARPEDVAMLKAEHALLLSNLREGLPIDARLDQVPNEHRAAIRRRLRQFSFVANKITPFWKRN
jgi:hypothetical protein